MKTYLIRIVTFCLSLTLLAAPPAFVPTPDMDRALAGISPDALRGDLSFLSSDLLEGRDTPSRGLDIAAEYIAAQFRCAGLAAGGDDGYFQTAAMPRTAPPDGFDLRIRDGARVLAVPKEQVAVISDRALDLDSAPVYKARRLADLPAQDLKGQVLAVEPSSRKDLLAIARAAVMLQPAALLIAARSGDPQQDASAGIPRLVVRDAQAVKALHRAKTGATTLAVSLKLATPASATAKVRNVIGLLRGSDPALRDQYVMLTAHYDHLGMRAPDQIFHGANDDGSGTVSVLEIARALAAMPTRPRRSIVFMTFFGEEKGDLGSRYYVGHPRFPLDKTVADLNLEQLGRTDATVGRELSNASLTGFDYSDVPRTLQQAGKLTGINVYRALNGDDFFNRSDNVSFAEHGIPAHTIVVAFDYPDYHATGDVWEKIDYGNMAKVDRMIALGTIMLANGPARPEWNHSNPKVAPYLQNR